MESIAKEPSHKKKADGEEGSQAAVKSLSVALVLRKILELFSNPDLLTLSLVNKLWNYEARTLMRKRDSLTASLKLSSDPSVTCQSLTHFASDLHQMNVVPFCGISFLLTAEGSHECEPTPTEEPALLDSSYTIILDSLEWKHLSVTLTGLCWKCKRFPGFYLLKRIFKDKCNVLEQLSISLDSTTRGEFVEQFLFWQGCSFPSLGVLKLGQLQQCRPSDEDAKNIKALLLLAPKLQEVRIPDWCVNIKENVIQNTSSSAVILTNCLLLKYHDPYCGEILDVVRFEKMILGSWPSHFNVTCFHLMMPQLLQRSRTTLRSLCLHAALAVPLMFYGVSCDNLRKLAISMDFDWINPKIIRRLMSLFKDFDFTRTFPNLDRVITGYFEGECGSPSEEEVDELFDLGKELRKEPLPERAVKIKHLSISKALNETTAPFLAEMLPGIEILSVDPVDTHIPFGIIWEHWAHVKELHVRSYYTNQGAGPRAWGTKPNLDSDFCGIFPEEVAELRKQTEEYLREVNIVPVKPSIGCLKDLRTFKCYFEPYYNMYDPPVLSITEVTGLIAFARLPNLVVTLQTVSSDGAQGELLQSHMKPYASVVPEGSNIWPWNDMNSGNDE